MTAIPPFDCLWTHHGRESFENHSVKELLEHLLDNDRQILSNQEKEMVDDSKLSGELDTLDTDEQANATAAAAILQILSTLQAGTISQAQIDQLTAHAATIAGGLEATTASEVAAEPPAAPSA